MKNKKPIIELLCNFCHVKCGEIQGEGTKEENGIDDVRCDACTVIYGPYIQ